MPMEGTDVVTLIEQQLGGVALLAVVVLLIWRITVSTGLTVWKATLTRAEEERSELQRRLDGIESDVRELQNQLDSQTRWRRIAVRHIRDLREFISRHMPDEQMPAIPPGLDLDE